MPGFITPNAERSGVWRLRCAFCAEETFGYVPPAFGKLRRTEGHVHIIGIVEDDVVVSVDVAIICWTAETPARCGNLRRVVLEHPIANVNDVDVLLDDDVAGKNAVVNPVAQTFLDGRRIGPGWPFDVACQIVRFAADNIADRPIVDALH